MLAHIHHRGQLSSGNPIRAVVEQQAGQIDIASADVDEMIAPDGRTIPVTGQDNHRELRMGHFYPCGEREGTPVDGVHRVEVQITSSTAGAPMPIPTTVPSFFSFKGSAALRKAPSTVPIPHPGHQM